MEELQRQCPRCGNKDPTYFFYGARGWYCRKCISYRRFLCDDVLEKYEDSPSIATEYQLPFSLSPRQKAVAQSIKDNYRYHNILVHAACGSGKTELMLDFIVDALARGYRVAWAIPRRAVVLQLAQRLRTYFPELQVIAVCQGYTSIVSGDLIICTTHQLYRYYRFFDYLIIDEPDAFPFKGDEVLQNIALSCVKGKIIFLTATPDEFVYRYCTMKVELFERPHRQALDIPQVIRVFKGWDYFFLWHLLGKSQRKIVVFFSSIELANQMYKILRYHYNCQLLTSLVSEKEKIIGDFIRKEKGVLLSTTILERGLTLPNIDVIVFRADSPIFDEAALIQMAGRVGRTKEQPHGKIWFITNYYSKKVESCIKAIQRMNLPA